MPTRAGRIISPIVALPALLIYGSLISGHCDDPSQQAESSLAAVTVAPGWKLKVGRELPATVTAMVAMRDPDQDGEFIYVGTSRTGGIYRLYEGHDIFLPATRTIVQSLGDRFAFGECQINRLALCDLDRDGIDELIAETSQLVPPGPPRLYVFSLIEPVAIRAFARPRVESNWGHGIGFSVPRDNRPASIFSTYCGLGEVIEYQLSSSVSTDGFVQESLGWRSIGQLPGGGEAVQVCDVDNDGSADLCLGNGYQVNSAAVLIYDVPTNGDLSQPKFVINENDRFTSVRFLVGNSDSHHANDLYAWWCVGLGIGETELIRYRLGPNGIEKREVLVTGSSEDLWPIDGQMTMADLDRDGFNELWFATATGNVWMYSPDTNAPPQRICRIPAGAGPIAPGGYSAKSFLYIGSDNRVLQLRTAR